MADGSSYRLFLLFCLTNITSQCQEKFIHGKRFSSTILKIIKQSRLFSCAADCVAYSLCKSVSFDRTEMTCFLHLDDDSGQPDSLLSDTGFSYSPIKDWDKIALGPCQTLACEPNEKCVVKRNLRRCVVKRRLLSRGKKAEASSIFGINAASFAVNGNLDPVFEWGSNCFHVDEPGGWWQVDLGSEAFITDVLIVNRLEACCDKRLRNFLLEVFTEDPSVDLTAGARICYRQPDEPIAAGAAVTFNCTTPEAGRYFRVSIPNPGDNNFIQMCEMEVYGWPIE